MSLPALLVSLEKKFVPGCFGGVCVEVLRLYKIHIAGSLPGVPNSEHYWWVSVLFILCAGGVAHYWNDKHALRSFYIGLSFPALVAAFTR
jgi:hypothetical protein